MDKLDKEVLMAFMTRTGMFISPIDKQNIQSFITGYTGGRRGECKFIDIMKVVLEEKYSCKQRSTGWVGQIFELAKRRNESWKITFHKMGIEILLKYSDSKEAPNLNHFIYSKIISLLSQIPNYEKGERNIYFNSEWRTNWNSVIDVNENWFKNIWNTSQIDSIDSINQILKKIDFENIQDKHLIKLIGLREQLKN